MIRMSPCANIVVFLNIEIRLYRVSFTAGPFDLGSYPVTFNFGLDLVTFDLSSLAP